MPLAALALSIQRDDGIVVWLNGTEIFRDNMPGGVIAYNTLASSSLGPPLENAFVQANLSAALLAPGTNILAVEIHQGAIDSSDISFDLELTGTLALPEPQLSRRFNAAVISIQWPGLAGPFRVEDATNLVPPLIWTPVTNSINNDGYWKSLVVTNTRTGQRFFRLNRF